MLSRKIISKYCTSVLVKKEAQTPAIRKEQKALQQHKEFQQYFLRDNITILHERQENNRQTFINYFSVFSGIFFAAGFVGVYMIFANKTEKQLTKLKLSFRCYLSLIVSNSTNKVNIVSSYMQQMASHQLKNVGYYVLLLQTLAQEYSTSNQQIKIIQLCSEIITQVLQHQAYQDLYRDQLNPVIFKLLYQCELDQAEQTKQLAVFLYKNSAELLHEAIALNVLSRCKLTIEEVSLLKECQQKKLKIDYIPHKFNMAFSSFEEMEEGLTPLFYQLIAEKEQKIMGRCRVTVISK